MTTPEDILKNRINFFQNKECEKIYEIYGMNSDFHNFFENINNYREHFEKLTEKFMPESVEIYKVLYNKESAEILFLEKVRDLENNQVINYYSKGYFILEEGSWKILKEVRESNFSG